MGEGRRAERGMPRKIRWGTCRACIHGHIFKPHTDPSNLHIRRTRETEPQSFPIIQFDTSNPPAFPTHSLAHLHSPNIRPSISHTMAEAAAPTDAASTEPQARHVIYCGGTPTHSLALREPSISANVFFSMLPSPRGTCVPRSVGSKRPLKTTG